MYLCLCGRDTPFLFVQIRELCQQLTLLSLDCVQLFVQRRQIDALHSVQGEHLITPVNRRGNLPLNPGDLCPHARGDIGLFRLLRDQLVEHVTRVAEEPLNIVPDMAFDVGVDL